LIILLVAALLLPQTGGPPAANSMRRDVDGLVRAAEKLTDTWPSQAPPPIPEVGLVVRHGKPIASLLVARLSDNPNVERDRARWKVQQQVSLALSRIYSESEVCGAIYCDGDPAERVRGIKELWVRRIAFDAEMQALSPRQLLDRFKQETAFTQQFELGRALAAANDRSVITELEPWLAHDDRHVRGNVAFVLGRLGDPRGFETIAQILADRSSRSLGQWAQGNWTLQAQIREDRYYAAHLLGDLKDPRGVELLISLLNDEDVEYIVPWALAEIGDRRAIGPLIERLERDDPSARVLAIFALSRLNAREALPALRELLQDNRRSNFGDLTTVAEAARRAIAAIGSL
jgi:hypothetical protein